MVTINNVHEQFATFFEGEKLKPFAYLVSKQLSEGHICIDLNEIITGDIEFPVDYQRVADIERDLSAEKLVGTSFEDRQPFILYNSRFYIQRYFAYETLILKRIKRFLENEEQTFIERKEQLLAQQDYIRELFDSKENVEHLSLEERVDWQQAASILAVLNNFTIITGGPGTGKTTTTAKLLSILRKVNPDLNVALAAPTGKAAARLAESLSGAESTTIHRLLKTIPNTHHFYYNEANTLPYDVVIIDEASMIDVTLFAKLLLAIGDGTRLILLGDKDQLASVEAGSLFRDLCLTQTESNAITPEIKQLINSLIQDSQKKVPTNDTQVVDSTLLTNHIIELKRSRRFDSNKGIGKLSKAIINNDVNQLTSYINLGKSEQVQIDTTYSEALFNQCVARYRDFIEEENIKMALKKFNEFRVLCAIREGEQGLYHINRRIEDMLARMGLLYPHIEFYQNRPIIVTSNYYNLDLYNGDIGIIRFNRDQQAVAFFDDGDGLKSIAPSLIGHCETVFAMTIHKSQGSEYGEILIVLPEKDDLNLLTRELLYTAITRAKKGVTIQSSEKGLQSTTERQVKRTSGISERFKMSVI